MKKKIAIIGASYLQLPAVLKAQELGYEVHCFAWETGAVSRNVADYFYPISIVEKEQILAVCRDIQIDGITSIASDLAVPTVNYIASRIQQNGRPLIANAEADSLAMTNKYAMRERFRENNIPSPRYKRISRGEEYSFEDFTYPLIVKPTDRSGSRGVERVDSPDLLPAAIERAQGISLAHEVIVEEFVTGREVSVESISWKGFHWICQITDKVTTGAPYFVELAHHQPSNLPSGIQERIRDIVLKALDALHVRYGASHAELKITPEGDIRVIEIGARMGGDFIGSTLVQLSTGYDFLGGVIQVAMGNFTPPQFTAANCSGVHFLCQETQGLKRIIQESSSHPEIVEACLTREDLRAAECSEDRSGYLIYKSDKRMFYL